MYELRLKKRLFQSYINKEGYFLETYKMSKLSGKEG